MMSMCVQCLFLERHSVLSWPSAGAAASP